MSRNTDSENIFLKFVDRLSFIRTAINRTNRSLYTNKSSSKINANT
jgi:hypothetical protein